MGREGSDVSSTEIFMLSDRLGLRQGQTISKQIESHDTLARGLKPYSQHLHSNLPSKVSMLCSMTRSRASDVSTWALHGESEIKDD